MGSQKSTSVQQIPKWMEAAGKATYDKAVGLVDSRPDYVPYTGDRYAGLNADHTKYQNTINSQRDNASSFLGNAASSLTSAANRAGDLGSSYSALSGGNSAYQSGMGSAQSTLSNLASPTSYATGQNRAASDLVNNSLGQRSVTQGAIGSVGTMPGMVANAQNRAEGLQLGAGDAQRSIYASALQSGSPYLDQSARMTMAGSKGQDAAGIAERMNPYLDQVIGNSLDKYNRGRDISRNQISDAARAASAFGGSRHGVAEGEFDRSTMEGNRDIILSGLDSGYRNAQSQLNTDRSRLLQGGAQLGALQGQSDNRLMSFAGALGDSAARDAGLIAQGGRDLASTTGQAATTGASLEGDLVNRDLTASSALSGLGQQDYQQQMGLAQAQQGQAESLNQQAGQYATALAALQNQAFSQDTSLAGANQNLAQSDQSSVRQLGLDQLQAAELDRKLQQQDLDFAYQQFAEGQQYPYEQLNYLQSIASMTPYSKSTTTSSPSNLPGQLIGAGATILAGISDPNEKENVKPLHSGTGETLGDVTRMETTEDALDAIATLPMSTYDYKASAQEKFGVPGNRRIGFMADEWAKRFGGDGKTVDVMQALGALAASVQALAKRTETSHA